MIPAEPSLLALRASVAGQRFASSAPRAAFTIGTLPSATLGTTRARSHPASLVLPTCLSNQLEKNDYETIIRRGLQPLKDL